MPSPKRVVITGLGVATPIGLGIEAFWDALIEGRCGIGRVQAFDPSGLTCQLAGELPPFKLADFIPKTYRKNVKVMSRDIMIAMVCAYHGVADAGLRTKCLIARGEAEEPPSIDSTRFGANIGAGLISADLPELAGALATAHDDGVFSLAKWGGEGMRNLTPLWLLKFLPNMLACHVTIVHDAQAPSNTITCAEASSHLAIGEAFRTLSRGDADVCICGGAEGKVNPMALARPMVMGRLNTSDNDAPLNACRPFHANRAGTIAADGGGLIILESLEHARHRGARIYAELVGFGAGTSSYHWSKPDPNGQAVGLSLRKALADADVTPERIDLAVPCGMGTVDHDATEMAGWNAALGSRLGEIPALTTRGATGNCGAGAGAIDIAAAAMAVYQRTVPPSLNTDELDPACNFQFVCDGPTDAKIGYAVTSAQALAGGQTAALVLKRFEE